MARHSLEVDRVERLAETTLFVLGEERVTVRKEKALLLSLDKLDEADDLELADAEGRHSQAVVSLRAEQAHLNEVRNRVEVKRTIRQGIRAMLDEDAAQIEAGAREVSQIAVAAGFSYARPELLV